MPAQFIWYELMTSNVDAAVVFYSAVVGWTAKPFGASGMRYEVMNAGDYGVGGVMAVPADAAAMGARPAWLGYIHAGDVDQATESLKRAGGHVHRPGTDIPGVGRFSVVADPQGAMFMLMASTGDAPPAPTPETPGLIGWRELMAGDLDGVWDFYASQFGWTKADAVEMGEMGTYQMFNAGQGQQGGMMTKPPTIPQAYWGFYFNVPDIDSAAARVSANGGKIFMEPMEVPGGQWVLNASDPQGAVFGLVAPGARLTGQQCSQKS